MVSSSEIEYARELVKKERDATWRLRQYGISSATYGKWKVKYELTQLLTVVPTPNALLVVMRKLTIRPSRENKSEPVRTEPSQSRTLLRLVVGRSEALFHRPSLVVLDLL